MACRMAGRARLMNNSRQSICDCLSCGEGGGRGWHPPPPFQVIMGTYPPRSPWSRCHANASAPLIVTWRKFDFAAAAGGCLKGGHPSCEEDHLVPAVGKRERAHQPTLAWPYTHRERLRGFSYNGNFWVPRKYANEGQHPNSWDPPKPPEFHHLLPSVAHLSFASCPS